MDALIDALLDWIGNNTAHHTAHLIRPAVVEVSVRDLTALYYKGKAHKGAAPADGIDDRLNALYIAGDGATGTIFIRPAASIEGAAYFDNPHDNPLWREILLHELVHHTQHASGGPTWDCVALSEAEAYTMGGLYFDQLHLPDPLDSRAAWTAVKDPC